MNPFSDVGAPRAQAAPAADAGQEPGYEFTLVLEAYHGHEKSHVVVPEGTTCIQPHAFKGHGELETIELPNSLQEIGAAAFSGCSSLKEISVPESVREIGGHAFANCENLGYVRLPKSLAAIQPSLFARCPSLKSVEGMDSIASIGENAFSGCVELAGLESLDSVTKIGARAFSGCRKIDEVELCVDMEEVGDEAFRSCSGLVRIRMPLTVERMGRDLFAGCPHLSAIEGIEALVEQHPGAFPQKVVEAFGIIRPQDLHGKQEAYRKGHGEEIEALEGEIAACRKSLSKLKASRIQTNVLERSKRKELQASIEAKRGELRGLKTRLAALENPSIKDLLPSTQG